MELESLSPPRRTQVAAFLALLVTLSACAWLLLYLEARSTHDTPMDPTMGMSLSLFLASWVVMIVAMMFPAATPMFLSHFQVTRRWSHHAYAFGSTVLFMLGYVAVWAFAGVAVYLIAREGEWVAAHSFWLMAEASRFGGALLGFAGLYQLSAAKQVCLMKCRHEQRAVGVDSAKRGYAGTLCAGWRYGVACLGCCWLLCLILLPLGMLNVLIMALLAGLMFTERTLKRGPVISRLAGAGLLLYGCLVLLDPSLLPMVMS